MVVRKFEAVSHASMCHNEATMRVLRASERNLEEAVHILREGGIVAHPTETCYGFACDLTNSEAVEKLSLLKKRPKEQPISALFSSIEEAAKWVEWNEKAEELAKKYLPGPLTLILPSKKRSGKSDAIYQYIESLGSVGVRVSSHPVATKLAALAGIPLSTTSANLHGHPEPYSVEEILEQFRGEELQPNLILDGGTLPHAKPSTVVIVNNDKIEVVRRGPLEIA